MNVIITGATGMVGEGVLHECLNNSQISEVLIINRKPSGVKHPKLKEFILKDFFNLAELTVDLTRYDACFFCLGISSVGMNEKDFYRSTYELTLGVAKKMAEQNANMVFSYVSGAGTDSSELGKVMWARVKGKTENDLTKLPFTSVYNFRPGFLKPTPGLKRTKSYYKVAGWFFYPILNTFLPQYVSTLKGLGLAMINSALKGYDKTTIEVKDIKQLAKD